MKVLPHAIIIGDRLLLLGLNNHLTGLTKTNAVSDHIRVVSQGKVDNTSLISWHRLQGKRHLLSLHLFRQTLSQSSQGVTAALLIALYINNYRDINLHLMRYNKPNQILERGQGLSPPPNQNTQIIALYIKGNRRRGGLPPVSKTSVLSICPPNSVHASPTAQPT